MNFPKKAARALIVLLLLLAGAMAYLASTGQIISAVQNAVVTVTKPVMKLSAGISNAVSGICDRTVNIDDIMAENEEMKEEIARLRKKLSDYNKIRAENKEYKKILGIEDKISEYDISTARVIGRDGMSSFWSFTVDRGSRDGIEINDVVFSAEGVIGVVTDTGTNFAKVSTIASPAVSVGCFVGDERDIAILSGDYAVGTEPRCIAQYLPKGTKVKEGDIVTTSGFGSVFPPDLTVGTVESVDIDSSGNYIVASVKPCADVANSKIVFIISNYNN